MDGGGSSVVCHSPPRSVAPVPNFLSTLHKSDGSLGPGAADRLRFDSSVVYIILVFRKDKSESIRRYRDKAQVRYFFKLEKIRDQSHRPTWSRTGSKASISTYRAHITRTARTAGRQAGRLPEPPPPRTTGIPLSRHQQAPGRPTRADGRFLPTPVRWIAVGPTTRAVRRTNGVYLQQTKTRRRLCSYRINRRSDLLGRGEADRTFFAMSHTVFRDNIFLLCP